MTDCPTVADGFVGVTEAVNSVATINVVVADCVSAPAVPVIVIVWVPVGVVPDVCTVRLVDAPAAVGVTVDEAKVRVVPVGPAAVKDTLWLNPLKEVRVTVYVVDSPLLMVRLAGEPATLKDWTVRYTGVWRILLPAVPLMFSVKVPSVAVIADVETVMVAVPRPGTLVGLKVAVAPVGKPVALS